MESLKQFFGFMMFAAAIWLLWVLANQVDANSILFVLIGWFSLAFASWLVITKIKFASFISAVIALIWGTQLIEWDFKNVEVMNESESIMSYINILSKFSDSSSNVLKPIQLFETQISLCGQLSSITPLVRIRFKLMY